MRSVGTAGSVTDSYGLPMNADSPTPKIDSARPEATWLAISVSVRKAKIERHQRAGGDARERAQRRAAGVVRRREAGDRADGHDALGAEVQHARLLGDELAQRGEDERRAGDDGRDEDRGEDAVFHDRSLSPSRRSSAAGS